MRGLTTGSRITAIVPRLPPAVDGLGDYGLSLARQLRQDFGLETQFVVADPAWTGPELDFPVSVVRDRSVAALQAILLSDVGSRADHLVLLHYVGYGYARRGCPMWLIAGLEAWRQGSERRHLLTMFHELYAQGGPAWSSVFWTSPLQQWLAYRLARRSDRCLTNRSASAQKLQLMGHSQPILALPVFSTVGESKVRLPLSDREPRLVVFGGVGPRSRVYQRSLPLLEQVCCKLEIQEIIDIGPPLEQPLPQVAGQAVKVLGIQPAAEISRLLAGSKAGFFDYPLTYIEKSTIFAAYCAHGLLPVGVSYPGLGSLGIEPGQQFWSGDCFGEAVNGQQLQAIANQACAWYQDHNLKQQAAAYYRLIESMRSD